ncbi:MAG: hypothetical protein PHG19_00020 [Anaerotignum sp.]|nr:hypothetical protein [Anaerotignum sp.]
MVHKKLHEIVDDYYFDFPTLLDGAETAPSEDVGGLHGFYEFLEVYRDAKYPKHEGMKDWAEEWNFKEYDLDWIKDRLKKIDYNKTEWGKIKREKYNVIEDKYRK